MPSDFTPNSVWASTPATGTEEEITLPSGQTCRAKRMSLEAMLAEGLLAEADAVTAMVSKHIQKAKSGKSKNTAAQDAIDVPSLMKDPKAVSQLVMMIDRLMPHIIILPVVRLHFAETKVGQTVVTKMIPIKDRESGVVYTDQIGLEDKMWLFDWAAGGLGAMLNFRE